jgi:group I intron endonuclease
MSQIYGIKNIDSCKIYVGSSSVPKRRKSQHFSDLRKGRHPNRYLQNAFNKYGEGKFEWIVLENCDNDMLAEREKYWIECLHSDRSDCGYNLTNEPYAPMRGKKHSVLTIMKYCDGRRKGVNHGNSKLNENIINVIFQLYKEGFNQCEISNLVDTHHTNVSLILKGKAWSNVGLSIDNPRSNNKSGCVGVYLHKSGKWIAEIIKNKKYFNLGSYNKLEDAIQARLNAEGEK